MNKNNLFQKGFIVPVLLGIIGFLIIAGGLYLYTHKEAEAPIADVPIQQDNTGILGNKDDLVYFSVKAGDTVSGPLQLYGTVKNAYFFEGNIKIFLLDSKENILKEGFGTATTDWMTAGPVSFTSSIDSTGLNGPGFILIQNDDPSGGEGGPAKKILIPVIFGNVAQETMTIKVYLGDAIDGQSCWKPSYVERLIPKTTAVALAAINELLKGPTEAEKKQDYWTGLNSGISIKSLSISNGVAAIDFLLPLGLTFNAPGNPACSNTIAITQVEKTLEQFSTVKSVKITVNGKPAENYIILPD